jgi:hypothetical protein
MKMPAPIIPKCKKVISKFEGKSIAFDKDVI